MTNVQNLWDKIGELADAAEDFGDYVQEQLDTGMFDMEYHSMVQGKLLVAAVEYRKAAKAVDADMTAISEPKIVEI